jgi:hypothetical protein
VTAPSTTPTTAHDDWSELRTVALLGTDRRPLPDPGGPAACWTSPPWPSSAAGRACSRHPRPRGPTRPNRTTGRPSPGPPPTGWAPCWAGADRTPASPTSASSSRSG